MMHQNDDDYPQALLRPLFVLDGWRVSLTTTYYRNSGGR